MCGCCVSQAQGKLDEAEPLMLRALTINEKMLGADHPDVAQGCNNLAMLYQKTGRVEEAEALYVECLAACRRVNGDEHPETLISVGLLAMLYEATGRPLQAAPLYEEVLRGRLACGDLDKAEPYARYIVRLLEENGLPTAAVEALCAAHGCACR